MLENAGDYVEIMTPAYSAEKQSRGCTLSLRFKKDPKGMLQALSDKGVITDFREPDIIRVRSHPPV